MATQFFVAWQTWEKLIFVLACAIMVIVCIGGCIVIHSHIRLQKHAAIEKEKRELALHHYRHRVRNNVPFGIRALESGIRTEGVWVSRDNTPERSIRKSSATSSAIDQRQEQDTDSDPEKRDNLPMRSRAISHPQSTSAVQQCESSDESLKTVLIHSFVSETGKSQGQGSGNQTALLSNTTDDIDSAPSSRYMPASEGAAQLKLPALIRQSFEREPSRVARGFGSGFEVLIPGSLESFSANDSFVEPNTSAQPGTSRETPRCSPRKMRKTRRRSMSSQRSSDIDVIVN